jgi:hypothetical protein
MGSWIDNYFESLANVNAETGQSEALALKRSNFPKVLYRYRSLERLEYTLEELRDGYVFLSKPADFNDPYDSALSVSWEQQQKQALEELGPEYGYDPKIQSKFLESLGEREKEYEQQAFEDLIRDLLSVFYGPSDPPDLFSRFRNLVRVGCFATNPNSVVMWSHYAKKHTGICVEVSGPTMLSSAKFLELLHPVRYTEKFSDAFQLCWPREGDLYQVRFDLWPILAACHKSEEWRYEGEWRLISSDPASEPKFSLASCGIKPSRIILGARIDRPNEAAIKELAQKVSVPVINARLAKDRFEIEFN